MGIYRLTFSANFRSPWAVYRPPAAPNSVELLRGAVCIFSVVLRSSGGSPSCQVDRTTKSLRICAKMFPRSQIVCLNKACTADLSEFNIISSLDFSQFEIFLQVG